MRILYVFARYYKWESTLSFQKFSKKFLKQLVLLFLRNNVIQYIKYISPENGTQVYCIKKNENAKYWQKTILDNLRLCTLVLFYVWGPQ